MPQGTFPCWKRWKGHRWSARNWRERMPGPRFLGQPHGRKGASALTGFLAFPAEKATAVSATTPAMCARQGILATPAACVELKRGSRFRRPAADSKRHVLRSVRAGQAGEIGMAEMRPSSRQWNLPGSHAQRRLTTASEKVKTRSRIFARLRLCDETQQFKKPGPKKPSLLHRQPKGCRCFSLFSFFLAPLFWPFFGRPSPGV